MRKNEIAFRRHGEALRAGAGTRKSGGEAFNKAVNIAFKICQPIKD